MNKKSFFIIFSIAILLIFSFSVYILFFSNSKASANNVQENNIVDNNLKTTFTPEATNTPTSTTKPTPTFTPKVSIPETGALDKWIFYPVDKTLALPDTFVPSDLVSLSSNGVKAVSGSLQMRKEVIDDMESLFADAQKSGINLQVTSAYRSYSYQNTLFNSYVQDEMNKGKTKEEAIAEANRSSAMPGHSEHQLGTTCDVISTSDSTLDFTATNTKAWGWLDKNLISHGFVLSYPEGKEDKTGYVYEPWHIRWVGKDIAKQIDNTDYLNPNNSNTSTSYLRTVWDKLK